MIAVLTEREVPSGVADDESSESLVADQYVGTEPEHEVRNGMLSGRRDGVRQVVGGLRLIQEIRGSADLERRKWREWLIESDVLSVQFGGEGLQRTCFHR